MSDVHGSSTVKRRRRTDAELEAVDAAIVEAARAEHPVTLRGVYYRVVSAGAVEKTEKGYRLVGRQLLKLRRNGTVPYNWVTDGTRWVIRPVEFDDLDQMLADASSSYQRALWNDQPDEVQVFTEKDAISGVVEPVCLRWHVPFGVLRGFASETFAHSTALSVVATNQRRSGTTYVYQLGDHDPSGVDAWRDFTEKVTRFVAETRPDVAPQVVFERLAVTPEQVEEWRLPTRPTKGTDSRSRGFEGESVEVDAIPAPTLRRLVEDAITSHVDREQLRLTRVAERSERDVLTRMIARHNTDGGYGS